MSQQISISTIDGNEIKATYFAPHQEAKKVILIIPGVGIRERFYKNFALSLCQKGIAIYTFDFRGIGRSKPASMKGFQATVTNWAELDIEGMLQYILKKHSELDLKIIAHSGGGTILGLAPSAQQASSIMLVASPRCLRDYYKGVDYFKMWLILSVLYPVFSKWLGYFPSRWFKMGEDLPKGVALEWADWGRHFQGMRYCIGRKIERFYAIEANISLLSFDNDFFANEESVRGLSFLYKNAPTTHLHFKNEDLYGEPVDHFCFFKKKYFEEFELVVSHFINKKIERVINEVIQEKLEKIKYIEPEEKVCIDLKNIEEIIEFWKNSTVELNEGVDLKEIEALEKAVDYVFPPSFKTFYLNVNGFKDWDYDDNMFSIFSIETIKEEYSDKFKIFVPFCDYLINSYQIGFSKKDNCIYIDFDIEGDNASKVADTFEQSLIEIINATDKVY